MPDEQSSPAAENRPSGAAAPETPSAEVREEHGTGDRESICQKNPGFQALEQAAYRTGFLGVPYFTPAVRPEPLFNGWAYLLGPLYYLGRGMWRKALMLCLLGLVCYLPLLLPSDESALRTFLIEEYLTQYLGMNVLGLLLVIAFCTGHRAQMVILTLMLLALWLVGGFFFPTVDVGDFSSFFWLQSGVVWLVLLRILLYSVLGTRVRAGLFSVLLLALGFWWGIPNSPSPECWGMVAYPLWCGMMGTWDLYRHQKLGRTFWW